jgi:hypothetical protein
MDLEQTHEAYKFVMSLIVSYKILLNYVKKYN